MQKLEFKTAGIRGVLGKGENFLNITHAYRVADAYGKYLINTFPDAKSRGVVIGRDNRRESTNFAKGIAAVLASYGIKVYFSKRICPTPFVSYMIKKVNAIGGINITASHNPKEFNGIKAYNAFGSQILPAEVKQLSIFFQPYENYLDKIYIFQRAEPIFYISKKYYDQYLTEVLQVGGQYKDCSNIKIAFSPLHGTGAIFAPQIFHSLNATTYFATKQMINNRHFTHTKSPNPESPLAYEAVRKLGLKHQCDLLLVTDPDADRVGLGVWNPKINDYILLNGNETATLIFQYLLEITPLEKLNKYYLIYSFVSTTLPKIMAKQNGLKVIEIETGFKWVAAEINRQKSDTKMLFAFEESYGSLINDSISADKDAIQSLVILTKMASYYKRQQVSFLDLIENIYRKYGYIKSEVISIEIDANNPQQLIQLKKNFKTKKYCFEVAELLDYNQGYKNIEPNDTIIIHFANNCWISLRPSGTEPKLKIYIFSIGKTKKIAENNFKQLLEQIKSLF